MSMKVVDLTGEPVIFDRDGEVQKDDDAWKHEPLYKLPLPDAGDIVGLSWHDLAAISRSGIRIRDKLNDDERRRGPYWNEVEYEPDAPKLPEVGQVYVEVGAARRGMRHLWRALRSYRSRRRRDAGETLVVLAAEIRMHIGHKTYEPDTEIRITLSRFQEHYRKLVDDEEPE